MTGTPPNVLLTIAGSDPTSGAGISADLATFRDFDGYGVSLITALVDQGTVALGGALPTPEPLLARQLARLFAELSPRAIKIGLVPTPGLAMTVADSLSEHAAGVPVVLDPVLANGRGEPMVAEGTVEALRDGLLARVTLITPNAPEAALLTGLPVGDLDEARRAAEHLRQAGARAVLVKGGHLPGAPGDLLADETGVRLLPNRADDAPAAPRPDVHGTGCHLSSAVAALLAEGASLEDACEGARAYLREAVAESRRLGERSRHVVVHGPRTRAAASAAREQAREQARGRAPAVTMPPGGAP